MTMPDDEAQTAALLGTLRSEPSVAARERAFASLRQEFAVAAASTDTAAAARRSARWPIGIAAAILLVMSGGLTFQAMQPGQRVARLEALDGALVSHGAHWFSRDMQADVGAILAAGDSLLTRDGGALLRLSPDLSVRLASGSRARLRGADEIDLIAGEAFVDATPGTHAALRIVTPHGEVTHLGTQYLVRSGPDEIEVSVREGRAQLKTAEATSFANAGEWLRRNDRDSAVRSGKLPAGDTRFEWIAALPTDFKLEGATLGEFLSWFRRETGLSAIYAEDLDSGHLSQVQLKGSIENLEPIEALSLVLATADLAWHRDGTKVIIERRPANTG